MKVGQFSSFTFSLVLPGGLTALYKLKAIQIRG